MNNSRRTFLKNAAVSTACACAIPALIPRSALAAPGAVGANDRIVVGFVGTGGRARQLMEHIPQERAKIVAVADLWRQKMIDCVNEKKGSGLIKDGENWNMYDSDVELYEKEKLDCAFVITQDHCRTLAGARAILAGLDVYAEKPLTAYISEGRRLVNIVRKSKQIFQVGTQQRSMRLNEFGCRLIREGKLGKVKVVQACNYPISAVIPDDYEEQPIPEGMNWDAWQGPTPYRKFNGMLLGWMAWRDYSGGEMTNWGAHGVDQIQWALGADESGPVAFAPMPGGDGKVAAMYANGVEVRFELDMGSGPAGGAIFRCEKGNLEINRNNLKANPESIIADAPEPDPPEGPTWIARPHIENFFDCMATRERPHADVEIGHRSVSVCHLVNITRILNRPLQWDPEKEQFVNDDEANTYVTRPRRAGYELPEA
ncbi:MAG: Gfo/Idh/MocA family oxidoreductase [Thermoguttaceae bacterium]|nr:Gfo/Idh/MocA family oxidoreductase [Thermoguttaceae bacterium]MBR5757362.1 Gfo/Idh/MocA family oxidoreductase [Thermoguttaceae bacterium]